MSRALFPPTPCSVGTGTWLRRNTTEAIGAVRGGPQPAATSPNWSAPWPPITRAGGTRASGAHYSTSGTTFLRDTRYLIHDRDPMFTEQFVETLKAAGVNAVKLPPRSPNLNAYPA